jgi:myosin heavy subunit
MKAKIIAYITALSDVNRRFLEEVKGTSDREAKGQYIAVESMTKDLDNLIDFIEDIPSELNEPIMLILNNIEEAQILRKRIRELEDSCENMNDVEKNLHQKINKLEEETEKLSIERYNLSQSNKTWQKKFSHANELNENVMEELLNLREDNGVWQKVCNTLKENNKVLEETNSSYEQSRKNRRCISDVERKWRMDK